jgi:hypothetical protein
VRKSGPPTHVCSEGGSVGCVVGGVVLEVVDGAGGNRRSNLHIIINKVQRKSQKNHTWGSW